MEKSHLVTGALGVLVGTSIIAATVVTAQLAARGDEAADDLYALQVSPVYRQYEVFPPGLPIRASDIRRRGSSARPSYSEFLESLYRSAAPAEPTQPLPTTISSIPQDMLDAVRRCRETHSLSGYERIVCLYEHKCTEYRGRKKDMCIQREADAFAIEYPSLSRLVNRLALPQTIFPIDIQRELLRCERWTGVAHQACRGEVFQWVRSGGLEPEEPSLEFEQFRYREAGEELKTLPEEVRHNLLWCQRWTGITRAVCREQVIRLYRS